MKMFVVSFYTFFTSIILTLKVYRVNTVTKSSPQIVMLSSDLRNFVQIGRSSIVYHK
jgi:hypothetical protein